MDSDQESEIKSAVEDMVQKAEEKGLEEEHCIRLRKLVRKYYNVFRVGLSSGKAADIAPLKIELTADAKPTRVKIRKYSSEQREFLSDFMNTLQ